MTTKTKSALSLAAALSLVGCGAGTSEPQITTSQSGAMRGQLVAGPVSDEARLTAGGDFMIGLHTDGSVFAWGGNDYGQLGVNLVSSSTPVPVAGMSRITAVSAGAYHVTALRNDGTVWGWGNNSWGQLGSGTYATARSPVQVVGLSNVKAVSAAFNNVSALTADGKVWRWGSVYPRISPIPALVPGLSGIRSISSSSNSLLAVRSDGTAWGWGSNIYGQLGNGSASAMVAFPERVAGLSDVVQVSSAGMHSLALLRDGSVWAWGSNAYDATGTNGTNSLRPKEVKGLPVPPNGASGVKAIVASEFNSSVVYTDGSVWTWGSRLNSHYGAGVPDVARKPIHVTTATGAVVVAKRVGFAGVLDKDGRVQAVGANYHGQLGNNTYSEAKVPVQVVGLSGVGYLNLGKSAAR